MVRVAFFLRVARRAVKAHQQSVGAGFRWVAVGHPVVANALRQCADVAGVFGKTPDGADFRLVAQRGRPAESSIEGCGRGACGVLRVERQQQDAVAALGLEPAKCGRDRRLPVAHGVFDDDLLPGLAKQAA